LTWYVNALMSTNDSSRANTALFDVMMTRGLQAPLLHVVWTAITAGALWRVVHDSPLRSSSLADWRFVSPFIAVVLLHFTWNSPLLWSLPYSAKPILLGVIAWTIAFGLLFTGFREVRDAAASARPKA
jgi:RsiW-degrading membrane proteinase PrsW (M82 family)